MKKIFQYLNQPDVMDIRTAYTQALDEVLAEDEAVMSVEADLMGASHVTSIWGKYPERIMDVGVAEANMIGVSAGLSCAGKKVYAHTFAAFATRRAFDQIFISCAYGKNSIRIWGSDPGIAARYNGGTHMPFEDLGMMRTIPTATVLDICDTTMMKAMIHATKDMDGIVYLRADRGEAPRIYADGAEFEIGKGNVLRDGTDVTIITSGIMVGESLNAAEQLAAEGISAAVIDMFTIKPIDRELIVEYAKKTGAVVTTDNHNINGGLGEAVAAVLAEEYPVPMRRLAIEDQFGEVGDLDYLRKRFHLTSDGVAEKVHEVLKLKKA